MIVTATATAGCFIGSPAPSVPEGAVRVVAQDFDGPRWYCEDGDEIVLAASSPPTLHVSSVDANITNSWAAPDGRHFFALVKGHDFGQTFVTTERKDMKFGVEYVVPQDPTGDVVIARYASVGGHGPNAPAPAGTRIPTMRKFDGTEGANGADVPKGDPWSRETCWSPSGPFAQAAKAAGKSVHDLQLVGAQHFAGGPLPPGPHGHLLCYANVQDITEYVDVNTGLVTSSLSADAFVRPPYYARLQVDVTSQPHKAYVLANDGHGVVVDESPQGDSHYSGSSIFYFERGATGFLLHYKAAPAGKKEGAAELFVYSPGDLQNALLPPEKKEMATPLSPWPLNDKHELVAASWWCLAKMEEQ